MRERSDKKLGVEIRKCVLTGDQAKHNTNPRGVARSPSREVLVRERERERDVCTRGASFEKIEVD